MKTNPKIGAIIVAWHPEPVTLKYLIEDIQAQSDLVLVIDNTQPSPIRKWELAKRKGIVLIDPNENLGVAAAINRGVVVLKKLDCQYALLLDQDSRPRKHMVATLVEQLETLESEGEKVAAIGPSILDRATETRAPFVNFDLPFNKHLRKDSGAAACDFLITSGKLVNLKHWPEIGPMREAWFIDSIDLEWCFRARRKGFGIYGSFDTELLHSIGEYRRLWSGPGSPSYRHHSSDRLYTMMRNRVFLYRSKAPAAWIVHDLLRTLGKLAMFSTLIGPRAANLKAMLRGLRDGLLTRPIP